MAAGLSTKRNVGIRRMVTTVTPAQYRNFEPNGTQTYTVQHGHGYDHAGTHYAKGATIPYDSGGGTVYSNAYRLERDFNRGALDPSS